MVWWPFSSTNGGGSTLPATGSSAVDEAPDDPIASTQGQQRQGQRRSIGACTANEINSVQAVSHGTTRSRRACVSTSQDPNRRGQQGNASMAATWATLLEPFNKSHELPPQARTDPHIPQREQEPMTLTKLWQYLPFLAVQGTALTKAFINHHLYGPPKPSWGIELTLFTALLREVAAYSHLSDVVNLAPLLPTPKDGIVTPISFRVKRRNLRGFLAEADAAEDGKRMITGEWVINKRLWRRMQTEYAVKKSVDQDARVILYLHGGAYYIMSAESHRFLTISCSRYLESRVFAINYRLAPETRFPGQLHDAVSAYMRLIIDLKIPPENILVVGDSAGGGLSLALMMYLRDEGYPLPSGGILMSPWVDLTMSCESWTTNRSFDYLPSPKTDDALNPVKCLLGAEGILSQSCCSRALSSLRVQSLTILNHTEYLTHPYVSPLFGDFDRLPPLLIQAGDAEVLRDEITLLAHKASLAGVAVEHEIFEDCVHVFQAFLFLEASRKAFQSQRHFVKHKLPLLKQAKNVDFGQIDRDIAADAHQVDERGHADATSLPASPSPTTGNSQLHPEPDDVESDESDSERLSGDSTPEGTASPSAADAEASDPTSVDMDLTPSEVSTSTNVNGAQPRPSLRAYTSARNLGMSNLNLTPSADGNDANESSTRPRAPIRTMSSLHSRSSSHPDLRHLLEEYETTGPRHVTKVISSSRGGHTTPPVNGASVASSIASLGAKKDQDAPVMSPDEAELLVRLEKERQDTLNAAAAS
ncbi:BQ5605_C001g00506 [Microbotryum silenes-dioicae]|uniref:BQ5605_C001g00506 protein n=1 Tax=Microbotryum silenes-dioicae TaxID=796604 RepID=A0A2X0P6A3_9BASI|nr:BQ5605_C001g00506 [Microbotryum silenes-dioicae]